MFFVCLAERSSNTFASETGALWLPFQTAAGTVTTLYKGECNDIGWKWERDELYIYTYMLKEICVELHLVSGVQQGQLSILIHCNFPIHLL